MVLEIHSSDVCDSGLCEEAEAVWKEEAKALEAEAKQRCLDVKHAFARTARVIVRAIELNSGVSMYTWPSHCSNCPT